MDVIVAASDPAEPEDFDYEAAAAAYAAEHKAAIQNVATVVRSGLTLNR